MFESSALELWRILTWLWSSPGEGLCFDSFLHDGLWLRVYAVVKRNYNYVVIN